MINDLLDKYEKELKFKISLKMIPNKTEEHILYQYFKFFDLDGGGFCNLRDFIKANEKLGVVLGKIQEFQEIFNYFDTEHCGVINYRKFCKDIFKPRTLSNQNTQSTKPQTQFKQQKSNNEYINLNATRKPLYEKLTNILLENGSARALISLCKSFILLDFNNTGRLTIDEFIKLFTENNFKLNISDIQNLFHSYEYNNDGFFYYSEMFNDLKSIFWNKKRSDCVMDLFNQIAQGSDDISVNYLKNMFIAKRHKYISEVGEEFLLDEYNYIVDSFLCIKRMNRGNIQLSKNDFEDFFKFYFFGIDSDEDFIEIISNCFYDDTGIITKEKETKREIFPKNTPIINKEPLQQKTQIYQQNNNKKKEIDQIEPIIVKLQKSLMKFGLKTLFGLMKHFKYYDNGTKMITKYDFAKVLKDFRLNLTISEIEKIFEMFCPDSKNVQLNYEEFIYSLTSNQMNDTRLNIIDDIYEKISTYANRIGEKVSIDLIKSLYWSKDNFFRIEENQALNEFCDNIEIFHFSIKGYKSSLFPQEEFVDFYTLISFLIPDDNQFIEMIQTEWKQVKNEPNTIQNTPPTTLKSKIKQFEPQSQMKPKTPIQTNEKYQQPQDDFSDNIQSNIPQKRFNQNEGKTNYTRAKSASRIKNVFDNKKADKVEPLQNLQSKLRKRGIRGLMNLHKQFLFSCSNLQTISFDDFVKVLKLQRLDLLKEEYSFLFEQYCNENNSNYLNFPNFIRAFKKVLNDNRLNAVEKVFAAIDIEQNANLFIDDIKLNFNPKKHPDVVRGIKNEDEIITEFLDCFELNYNLLTTAENPETSNLVSFEEFANFYEYVSFLYDSDMDFIKLVEDSWI